MECSHQINMDDQVIVFNGLTLNLYKIPNNEKKLEKFYKKYNEDNEELFETINLQRLSRLNLCISSSCNLECKYCYEGQLNSSGMMGKEVLTKAIDFIFETYPGGIELVQFFGGEPLLNKQLLKDAIKYVNEESIKRNIKEPMFTIVTNGTLLTKEIHELFNKYFKRITISLDGKKEVNDVNRCYKDTSMGSVFDTVSSKIKEMNKDRNYCIDVQMTITELQLKNENVDICDYMELKRLGVESIHITPLIYTENYTVQERELYKKRIIKYFNLCYEEELKDVDQTNSYKLLSHFNTLRYKKTSEHYCGAGFLNLSIDVKGNIYPCFMFNENNNFVMGNVVTNTETFLNKRDIYLNNTISKNVNCNKCWAKKICFSGHSGCIGAYYIENGKINEPISSNCEITKSCFETVFKKIASYT